jgi:hypothetical protein
MNFQLFSQSKQITNKSLKRKLDETDECQVNIQFNKVFLPSYSANVEYTSHYYEDNSSNHKYFDPLSPELQFHNYARSGDDPNTFNQSHNIQSSSTSPKIYIQNMNCFESAPSLPQCQECSKNPTVKTWLCRFYQFRKLFQTQDGSVSVYGFLDPQEDPNEEDNSIWMNNDELLAVDNVTRDYLLKNLVHVFCELSKAEKRVHEKWKKGTVWRRPVLQVREQCDVCHTSLFNIHWTCHHCGTYTCLDCYSERQNEVVRWKPKSKIDKEERDKFFWLKCNHREGHDLILTQMITNSTLSALNQIVHQLCQDRNISSKCACELEGKKVVKSFTNDTFVNAMKRLRYRSRRVSEISGTLCYSIDHKRISKNRIIKFLNPKETEIDYMLFQNQWERGVPVIVANANRNMNREIWKPEYFSKRFGNDKHEMVNCANGAVINRVAMKYFWNGFASIASRIPNGQKDKVVLKLKDWPTTEDFSEIMKEHFEDLMKSVPMKQYTTRNGRYNLTRNLPNFFSKPDLGPKMYSAYSQIHPANQGSTNLHLDVSDAVNVMVHVSRPNDFHLSDKQYSLWAMRNALEEAGADEEDIMNVENDILLPGAIWHIWDANQADGIRKILREESKLLGRPQADNDDPIHDQNWYINKSLREKLENGPGVVGYTIVQYEGDAVFVPAGAPHQVINILDCIKIALDFVAPENLPECVNLTEEFRILSTKHQNHEDKLQVKNIMYHTLKNIVPIPKSI